ncbi:hypothetical protein SCAR479_05337 [Seiridium cardinale]|uniref:Uncharacterized protein n=1 Tax=Seiridium cardinale TaxID=138064 RepID=A0ABR2XW68_9PEZI
MLYAYDQAIGSTSAYWL